MNQQTTQRHPTTVQRALLITAAGIVLVVIATASRAPWIGSGTTHRNPDLHVLDVVIDDDRVIVLSAEGTFHNEARSEIVIAAAIERQGPYYFTVSSEQGLVPAATPTNETWMLTVEDDKGVVINAPNRVAGWVPTAPDEEFRLIQLANGDRNLTVDDPVTVMGLDIAAADTADPPELDEDPNTDVLSGILGFLLSPPGLLILGLLAFAAIIGRSTTRDGRPPTVRNTSADIETELYAEAKAVTDPARLLTELRANPDRGRAVRLAYTYATIGQPGIPARDPEATPHEWLHAVRDHDHITATHAAELVEWYAQVRFADRTPTEAERAAAIDSLEATLAYSSRHTSQPAL